MTLLDEYLKSLGIELWPGEAFYLTDEKSRADAVKWLEGFSGGFRAFVRENDRSTA